MVYKQEKIIPLSGCLIAGGESSRMGSDKGLVFYRGVPMAQHSIGILNEFCDEVIISANNPEYNVFGFPVYSDTFYNSGPLSGIYTALENTKNEWCLVLSCDIPNLKSKTIYTLLEGCRPDAQVICFVRDGFYEPLIALYHRNIITRVKDSLIRGELSLQKLIKECNPVQLEITVLTAEESLGLISINTPDMLI